MTIFAKIIDRIYPPRHLLFHLQRQIMRPAARQRLARLASRRLPAVCELVRRERLSETEALDRNGYVMLPELVTAPQIDTVLNYLADKPVYDRWCAGAGTFSAAAPPPACHTALYRNEDVVDCPHILGWANDPRVLAIVSQVLGAKPTLSNLTIWWSYPGHDTPQEAENFHRDVDDLHFIKLFVYLTEVDADSGPHAFVPGSQRHPRLLKIRRYQDQEVEAVFGREGIRRFTGPRGTSFLENTFGLHKGQLPASRRRALFQAQYSLHPIGIYRYQPALRQGHDGPPLDPYVNRLYVKR